MAGEGSDALIGVGVGGSGLLRPERIASHLAVSVIDEVMKGEALLRDLGIELGGRPAQGCCEVVGVNGELGDGHPLRDALSVAASASTSERPSRWSADAGSS